MARYVIIENNLFHDSFLNFDEAQNHAMEKFEAKLIDDQLCDKHGNRKSMIELFEDNRFDFQPLKSFIDQYGITENDIATVHIEDGQLVITLKDGTHKKIIY